MTSEPLALIVDHDKCEGRLACMRACPTDAIRYRDGKISINATLCIDCGECIVVCPEGAIQPRTDPWESVQQFKYKVAIISPVLFGQFPRSITPCDIVEGLLDLGFDAIHDLSLESELYFRAIQDYLKDYSGPLPLISSMCPVVVRLVQVSYPNMVDQITPLKPPREIAGREAKKKYSERLGIPESEVGAIYISPCPAKMSSIKQPAEGVKSHLDLALGIRDIYNPLLAVITKKKKESDTEGAILPESQLRSKLFLNLPITGGLSHALDQKRYITVAQLPNIFQVIEDIEKGKIRSIDFLECFACTGGCIGGPLTVDNRFVARSKIQKVMEYIADDTDDSVKFVEQHYIKGDYFLDQPLKPRPIETGEVSIFEQIERMKKREEFAGQLPGLDCGLCGSPSCQAFANDVADGDAQPSDCVFLSDDRINKLRAWYKVNDPSNNQGQG